MPMPTRLSAAYRAAMAPWGRRALRRMEADGLPETLLPPLRFLFDGRLDADERRVVERIEAKRQALAERDTVLHIATGTRRTARWIAQRSSIRPQWGAFLHLCAKSTGARVILELGSCAGISGCYLGSSPTCTTFVTIEGSEDLAAVAESHLSEIVPGARVVRGLFDDRLEEVLRDMPPVDLAYIDGDHTHEATLRYFRTIEPHLADRALVVLDDIRWSPGMWAAWTDLRESAGLRCSVNAGRLGLCLVDGGRGAGPRYDLSRYTGWLRVERR